MRRADATKSLGALLRERGFRGSAPTFRRFVGRSYAEVVNLQATSGEVYVNLGAHHRWLGKPSTWDAIKEYECAFRARLRDFANGERFDLTDDASVTALLEMMRLEGFAFFERVVPERIAATARQLAKDGYTSFVPFGAAAGPETWAKVAARFDDASSAKRLRAQAMAAEKQRDRERAAEAAGAVEMTYDEYRRAKKEGRRLPKIVRIVLDEEPAKRSREKRPTTRRAVDTTAANRRARRR